MLVCRNIKVLFNFEPPASREEVGASALQYVRKLSGSTRPSQANQEVFERAVQEVTEATLRLLADLRSNAAPKDRSEEAAKAKERNRKRFGASQ